MMFMAKINNSRNDTVITGTSAADSIYNHGGVTIYGNTDDAPIYKYEGSYVSIDGRAGNDFIHNNGGRYVTITGNTGNDTIANYYATNSSIGGGAGNDSIYIRNSDGVTINGGADNDTINNDQGHHVSINGGAGDDLIYPGSDSTVDGDKGDDCITNTYGGGATIHGNVGNDTIANYYGNGLSINGGAGNDSIYNYLGDSVTVDGGDGEDMIQNYDGSCLSITGGNGNDTILNEFGWQTTLSGGDGDDSIRSYFCACASINGDAGDDDIAVSGNSVTIDGGAGNDTIFYNSDGSTLNGGADNDIIDLASYAKNNLIKYTAGDGNDTIYGFNGDDTLQIGNGTGTYSTTKSGNDLIVKVGDGSITFKDSANLSLNIDGIEAVEETLPAETRDLRESVAKALEDFIAIGAGTAKLGTSDLANADADDEDEDALAEKVHDSEIDIVRFLGKLFEEKTKYKVNADGTFQVDQSGELIEDDSAGRTILVAGYKVLLNIDSILKSAKNLASGKLSDSEALEETLNINNNIAQLTDNLAKLKGDPRAGLLTDASTAVIGLATNVVNAFAGNLDKDLIADMGDNLSTIFTWSLEKLGKDVPIQNVLPSEFTTWITGKTAGTKIESFVQDALKKNTTSYAIGVVTTAVGIGSIVNGWMADSEKYNVDGLPDSSALINKGIDAVATGLHVASNAAVMALTGGLLNADMIYKGAHIVGAAIKWSLQSGWARITGGDPSQVKFQMTDDRNFTEVIGDALKCWITGTTSAKDVVNEKKKKVYTTNGDNNITNYVSECVITSGTGNDYIFNVDGVYGTNIDAGNDDDNVFVRYRDNAVFGGQGNDEIMLSSDGKNPAYGNDIDGGPGDDIIVINETSTSSASKKANTVAGGEGNDRIIIPQSKTPVVIRYNVDDGEDYIGGYDSKDTIQIVNSNYTTTKSGDSVIINVGNGAMTLLGAAGKKLNIETLPADDGLPKGLSYNGDKTKITAYTTFRREQINLANYAPTVKQVNASSLVNEVNITGNALDNSIRGGKNSDTIKGDTGDDTLKGENGNDTIYGGTGDDKIDGGKGNDWIFGNAGNDSLKGGAGVDLFVYTLGDGNDTIVDYSNSDMIHFVNTDISQTQIIGSNVVFTAEDGGKLTVKNGKGKTFNITDTRGQDTSSVIKSSSSSDPTLLLLDNSHASSITLDFGVVTADASLRTKKTQITGNMLDNVLIGGRGKDILNGGAGNDVLTGGKGNDVFIYSSDDDIITDYASGDKISASSAMKSFGTNGDDLIINYADGSLTIKDAAGEKITFIENGKTYVNVYSANGILNGAGTAITLDASTTKFTADGKIVSIDASAVDGQLEIFGNSKANKIFAGDDDTTLNGGKGNDTLWGGNAADTFIYDDGGGRDVIFGFGNNDMLQLGDFTASVKRGQIFFNVGSQKNAVTLKDFTAATFNVNGDTYRIQGDKLVK